MWYHIKYQKWYDGNNLIIIYFKCSSVFCVIYENLSNEKFQAEKKRFDVTPTEHIISGNVYHSFLFYKINETQMFDKLRIDYNLFIIDIEPNKQWIERKDCLRQFKKSSIFYNIWSTIMDTLYEPISYNSDSSSDAVDNVENVTTKKISSFENMILEEIANKNINMLSSDVLGLKKKNCKKSDLSDIDDVDDINNDNIDDDIDQMNFVDIDNIFFEDELVTIKGKTKIDAGGLMNASDELVQIKRNPLDRTFSSIGNGKKITFGKK